MVTTDSPTYAKEGFHPLATIALFISCLFSTASESHDFRELVKQAKPSIVGIGTLEKTRRPPSVLMATGFVIGDGSRIVTNAHAIPELDSARREHLVIFIGTGRRVETRTVTVIATDKTHDLVILRQLGAPLPALKLAAAEPYVEEGSEVAFIGYPLGSVLGLYPVTHSGILAAVTPVVIPAAFSGTLSAEQVHALKNPYFIYQLDATAYPGNSGSPLLHPESGEVTAVINKVFVNSKKENVLSEPSGITYAIPVKHIHELLQQM